MNATRVFVTGTGTEVGKTWWTAATISELRRANLLIAARKPAQSFDPTDPGPTDAEVLAGATGEPLEIVSAPRFTFPLAMAPPMAAAALGRARFTVRDLVAGLAPADGAHLVFIEGAGGLRAPIADDGDNLELARVLTPAFVIVVADAGLGTLNSTRLTLDALGTLGSETIVALNRYDPDDRLHRDNREWLTGRDRAVVVTDPEALARRLATGLHA